MADRSKNLNRRSFERIPVNFMIHFYYGDSINFGTVTDISEKGMFVKTRMPLADVNSEFEIVIPSSHTELSVPVLVRRIAKKDDFYEGFGVELLTQTPEYLKHVLNLKHSAS